MTAVSIDDLLAGQTPGYTLPQAFHLDPEVYRLELERIWRRGWLFAVHTAELRHAGDLSVFDVGDRSALIVRGGDGALRAFHNVCRHRGSRLVDSAIASFAGLPGYSAATSTGVARGVPADPYIRCPYHQWAYRLDGSLAACGGMDRMDGFDPAANGLCPLDCAEVGGLVFVRFEPPAPASRPAARPSPSPRFTSWPNPYYRKAWKRQRWPIRRRILSERAGKWCGRTTASAGIAMSATPST